MATRILDPIVFLICHFTHWYISKFFGMVGGNGACGRTDNLADYPACHLTGFPTGKDNHKVAEPPASPSTPRSPASGTARIPLAPPSGGSARIPLLIVNFKRILVANVYNFILSIQMPIGSFQSNEE
jgi:hypothetical protein